MLSPEIFVSHKWRAKCVGSATIPLRPESIRITDAAEERVFFDFGAAVILGNCLLNSTAEHILGRLTFTRVELVPSFTASES